MSLGYIENKDKIHLAITSHAVLDKLWNDATKYMGVFLGRFMLIQQHGLVPKYTIDSYCRGYYRQVLGKVMEQQNGRSSPVVRKLLQMMSGDLSKAEVEADMFWVALHLAQ